ncbi:WYL domain-containing protein [Actinopolymorpha sp. B9G3]|uniref:helix-turn-helix transcriptional regulator n=1 Tax=Actinopolymorpha sp. B9G3 TaxID=3158970 RepID=UPI0032D923B3
MRASRLISVVLLLQARGRMTADELAKTLEVSVRTIYRDVESLNAAGIPLVGEPGNDGGYRLLDGYRTRLTGLTADEAESLFLTGVPAAAAALGLSEVATATQRKLLAAIPQTARERAEHARQRVHVDLEPWGQEALAEPLLPELHQAIWADRLILVRYGTTTSAVELAPLGLVCKGTPWYLLALRGTAIRTYRVSRLHSLSVTEKRFVRPADFDLVRHWQDAVAAYAETFGRMVVKLRLRGNALLRAQWVQARSRTIAEPDTEGWSDVVLVVEDPDNALDVIRTLGNDVIVVEPAALRTDAVAMAQTFVAANT